MAKRQVKEAKGATVATHRRARFDYEILDRWDAGIVLTGTEIKSIREGGITLSEGYARFRATSCTCIMCTSPSTGPLARITM